MLKSMKEKNHNHETLLNLVKTSTLISSLASKFFSEFKINAAQFNILMTLNQFEEGLSQRDLSEKLILTKSNMVGLIDRLEACKFVKRTMNTEDRRFNCIALTEQGKVFLKSIETDYFAEVDALINNIEDKEKKVLNNSLTKISLYLTQKLN
jgi:DNA-binding MarR family transcriptional regulator